MDGTWKFRGIYITSELLKRRMMRVRMVASEKFSSRGLFAIGNSWNLGFVRLEWGKMGHI